MPSSAAIYTIENTTQKTILATAAESANTSSKRRRGLLGRDSLPSGFGLLIAPCEAVHTFGMRFTIDVIFLDRNCRVLKVSHSVKPWRMAFCLRAHSVLELPDGTAQQTQTGRGDQLAFTPAEI